VVRDHGAESCEIIPRTKSRNDDVKQQQNAASFIKYGEIVYFVS
jgi:hypothetical protein